MTGLLAVLLVCPIADRGDLPQRVPGAWPKTWKDVIALQKEAGWEVRRPEVAEPEGLVVREDLLYATRPERELRLDLYLPDREEPAPLVVIIHGGGWKKGSKESQRNQGVWFASRGYAAAAIQYRLSGDALFPAAYDDCRAAIDWLQEHAAEHGYDADRLAVWGASAGAHLAALVATTDPDVDAGIVVAGPVDLTSEPIRSRSEDPESNSYLFLGGSHADKPALYRRASPFHQVGPETPPIFLICEQAIDERFTPFLAKLQQAGVEHETMVLAGGIHGHWSWEPWFTPFMRRCDAFLQKAWAE